MGLKQQIRHRFLAFGRSYFNPFTRQLIARSSRGPFAIVHRVGRRSGKSYETPIALEPVDGGSVFDLTYGPDVDWYKNILVSGGCTLSWHRKDYVIDKIEPLNAEDGRAAFPQPIRLIIHLIHKQHFFKMVARS
jgi:hypothetical protein